MKWTTFGRRIYAVGSNAEAAEVSGINVDRIITLVYMIMGLLAGLSGALSVSIYASAQPNMQYGKEMDVIAACVIGGVSMNGGRGSVVGTFLGALFYAIVAKALPLIGLESIWQNLIKGIIVLAVVLLNVLTQRAMDRANLERREL
jgi:rhamnose transport system permease protein